MRALRFAFAMTCLAAAPAQALTVTFHTDRADFMAAAGATTASGFEGYCGAGAICWPNGDRNTYRIEGATVSDTEGVGVQAADSEYGGGYASDFLVSGTSDGIRLDFAELGGAAALGGGFAYTGNDLGAVGGELRLYDLSGGLLDSQSLSAPRFDDGGTPDFYGWTVSGGAAGRMEFEVEDNRVGAYPRSFEVMDEMVFAAAPVPAPAGLGLLAAAAVALGLAARRRGA